MIFSAYLHILLALLVAMCVVDSTLLQQQQQLQPLQQQHDGRGMEMMAAAAAASNAEVDPNKFISAADSRNDGEYRTCVIKYQVNVETIIRTQDSKALGARYINETEVPSQEDCLLWCCQTEYCNVAIFERKERGSCYLFDCGPLNDFKCKFAPHHQYMSAILDTSNFESDGGGYAQQQQQQHHNSQESSHKTTMKQALPATVVVDEHIVALKNLKHQVAVNTEATLQSTATVKIAADEIMLSTVKPQTTTVMNQMTSVVPNMQPQRIFNANGDAVVEQEAGGRCSHFQFQCRSTKECIAVYNACDGIPQCADGSDESDELGCPTEGRRFANGGVVAESTLATSVGQPALHQQQQQQPAGSLTDNRLIQNKNTMKNIEEDEEHHMPNTHHKVIENLSPLPSRLDSTSFGRSNKAQVMDERYHYDSNVKTNNEYQSTDQRQNDYHSKPIAHVNNNNNNQGHSRLINERPLPLHNQHQLNSEVNRYEDNGGRFQAVEEEPIPHPHSEGYQGEENIAALRNPHVYNRQQMPSPYKSMNELGGDSSSYDNRHYDIPQAPRNYMKEYYEGGNGGGPAANSNPSAKENFQYKTNNNGLQKEMMYNNEKLQGSKLSNGDWNQNSNHYPPPQQQQQQQQMYEGRNEAMNDNYQYPEADISPVHVHVNVHQSEMEPQINHNKGPVNIQDKHLGGEYVKNNDNNEEAMNPPSMKEQNNNWNYSPQLNQGRLHAPNNFQTGQKGISQVAQKNYPEVVPISTQRIVAPTTTTAAPPNHQATGTKSQTKPISASIAEIKSLTRIQKKLEHNEVDAVYAQRSSESSGAIVALTLGLSITGLLLVLVGCRLRMVRRRLRKGRGPYAHDADYLVNGMYL